MFCFEKDKALFLFGCCFQGE